MTKVNTKTKKYNGDIYIPTVLFILIGVAVPPPIILDPNANQPGDTLADDRQP